MSRRFILGALLAGIATILPAGNSIAAEAQGDEKPRVLFLTQSKGYEHRSVHRTPKELSPAAVAMTQLAQQSGAFTIDVTQNAAADLTKENLQNYDIVMFYTTGDLPIAKEDLEYFLGEWLKQKGHGFVGVHSATDTYHHNKPYWNMIGGTFKAHPWTSNSKITLKIHAPEHPTMAPFGGTSVKWTDEIYIYTHWQPEKVRVLMSLDMAKTAEKHPYHVPIAWVKEYGQGRVYYNNLGHRTDTWTKKPYLQSLLAGILWASGKGPAKAKPNPELSARMEQAADKAYAAATSK